MSVMFLIMLDFCIMKKCNRDNITWSLIWDDLDATRAHLIKEEVVGWGTKRNLEN